MLTEEKLARIQKLKEELLDWWKTVPEFARIKEDPDVLLLVFLNERVLRRD